MSFSGSCKKMNFVTLSSIVLFVFVLPMLIMPSFSETELELQNVQELSQEKKQVSPFESSKILNADNTELEDSTIFTGHSYVPVMVKITGQIYESEFFRGLPVQLLIHQPDDSTELLKIIPTKEGYFETLISFDRSSMKGDYRVQIIYNDNTDPSKDLFFSVAR